MKHLEFERQAKDGLKLFFRCWQPADEARAVVCLLHGFGEHSGRYSNLAKHLTQGHYALLSFDLRGHGKSQGRRGHTPSINAFMDDIATLLSEAKNRFPNVPIFLYGHSMGGSLSLTYALRHSPKLAGVIAASPLLELVQKPSLIKTIMGNIGNLLAPASTVPADLNSKNLSRDPKVVKDYDNDPLVHDRVSARLFMSCFIESGKWALEHAGKFKLPLLIMHGGDDRITSAKASKQFADRVSGNCTYKLWPGLYHEIHNEPEQEKVFNYLTDWLNAHV